MSSLDEARSIFLVRNFAFWCRYVCTLLAFPTLLNNNKTKFSDFPAILRADFPNWKKNIYFEAKYFHKNTVPGVVWDTTNKLDFIVSAILISQTFISCKAISDEGLSRFSGKFLIQVFNFNCFFKIELEEIFLLKMEQRAVFMRQSKKLDEKVPLFKFLFMHHVIPVSI